jgi:transcriptional regulator with XRE-family HTH domain
MNMELNASIGERLRAERERLGLSQSEIAEVVAAAGVPGATRQSQSLYEKGKRMPDAAYLAVIASVGLDIGYILTSQRIQPTASPELPPRQRALLDNYTHMSKEDQAALERTASALAQSERRGVSRKTAG